VRGIYINLMETRFRLRRCKTTAKSKRVFSFSRGSWTDSGICPGYLTKFGKGSDGYVMSHEVLVLNSDYEPLNVCNMRRAIVLLYLGKADVLHTQEHADIHAVVSQEGHMLPTPSVLRLRYHVKRPMPELKLSRRSIFARDNYTCQYCGVQSRDLTIDHITPKRHGGGLHWENLVACCRRCNTRKGDKLLQVTGMKLARPPRRPRYVPYISLTKYINGAKNDIWRDYLPVFNDIAGITEYAATA